MGRASAGLLNGAGPTCRLILTMQRLNGDAEHWRTSPHRRPAGRPWALRDSLHCVGLERPSAVQRPAARRRSTRPSSSSQQAGPQGIGPGQEPQGRGLGQDNKGRGPGQGPRAGSPGQGPQAGRLGQDNKGRGPGQGAQDRGPRQDPQGRGPRQDAQGRGPRQDPRGRTTRAGAKGREPREGAPGQDPQRAGSSSSNNERQGEEGSSSVLCFTTTCPPGPSSRPPGPSPDHLATVQTTTRTRSDPALGQAEVTPENGALLKAGSTRRECPALLWPGFLSCQKSAGRRERGPPLGGPPPRSPSPREPRPPGGPPPQEVRPPRSPAPQEVRPPRRLEGGGSEHQSPTAVSSSTYQGVSGSPPCCHPGQGRDLKPRVKCLGGRGRPAGPPPGTGTDRWPQETGTGSSEGRKSAQMD
ncbi:unnamed protein product [Gadus morhua 'NCC']